MEELLERLENDRLRAKEYSVSSLSEVNDIITRIRKEHRRNIDPKYHYDDLTVYMSDCDNFQWYVDMFGRLDGRYFHFTFYKAFPIDKWSEPEVSFQVAHTTDWDLDELLSKIGYK